MLPPRHICLIALLTCALPAQAAGRDRAPGGFSAEISGRETLSYDSNPLRTVTTDDSLFGSTTSPQVVLRYKTPRSIVEADTRIDINQFNHTRYNSVDAHEKLFLSTRNARWIANLRGQADYDTTRTSELTNYALNLPKVRRTKWQAEPQLIFNPSPNNTWRLYTMAATIDYNHQAYTDYRLYSLSPGYEHQFDNYNRGFFALNARRYETASGANQSSDSFGPELGWINNLTQRTTLRISGGAEHTRKRGSNIGNDPNQWNYVFQTGLNYTGNVDTLNLSATRAREPFGNGTDTLLTTLRISERHAITPHLALKADAIYRDADYTIEPGINLKRGVGGSVGLAHTLTENIELSADYGVRYDTLTNTNGRVKQHTVMLGLNYHPEWSEL